MNKPTENHWIHHYDKDIKELKRLIYNMADLAKQQVKDATLAFKTGDVELAQRVCNLDTTVNALDVAVDRAATIILAKYQPKANDLRQVFGLTKMSVDFERIGDQARNIARVTHADVDHVFVEMLDKTEVITKAQNVLNLSIEALKTLNEDAAMVSIHADEEVDKSFTDGVKTVTNYLKSHPDNIEMAFDYLNLLKAYERIGDHATNIAEQIIFVCDGEDIRHIHLDDLPVARTTKQRTFICGPLIIDDVRHEAHVNGQLLPLSRKEFQLLLEFAKNPGRVYTREVLLSLIWDDAYVDDRTVDAHILRLRKRLREANVESLLQTVRGVGYKLQID